MTSNRFDSGMVRVEFESVDRDNCARLARVATLCNNDPDIILVPISLKPERLVVKFFVVYGTSKSAAVGRIEHAWHDSIATPETP